MASSKNLKKAVKGICGELFADCLALSSIKDSDRESIENLMARIATTYQDFVARINNPEPGMASKEYFSKLRADFTQVVNAISDDIMKL